MDALSTRASEEGGLLWSQRHFIEDAYRRFRTRTQ
jgi:hypothetical protein